MGIQRGLCPSSRGSWDRGWRKNAHCPAESLVWLPLKACLVPLLTCILHKYLSSDLYEELGTVRGCMGSNGSFIVRYCTCGDITARHHLIQTKEGVTENTGNVFHATKSEISVCRAASSSSREQGLGWMQSITQRGDSLKAHCLYQEHLALVFCCDSRGEGDVRRV